MRPLVGIDDVELPRWTASNQQAADAGLWAVVRALPSGARLVSGLAWQASRRLTVLCGVLAVLAGCLTAFGLLATADVLSTLLSGGPTPQRLAASLPAIGLVVGSLCLRALVDSAAGACQTVLKHRVAQTAQLRVHAAVARVELIAFEDNDYADLLRQCLVNGVRSAEASVRVIAGLAGSLVNLAAAIVTAGVLHPLLTPLVMIAVLPDLWSATKAARLSHDSFLRNVSRSRRLSVASQLLTARDNAAEVRACTAAPALLAEYGRISGQLTAEARRVELARTRVRLLGRALTGLGTAACFGVVGLMLYAELLALSLAGAAVLAMRVASGSLGTTMFGINSLYEHTLYLELYPELLARTRERTRPARASAAPADPRLIVLDDVSFSYPGQPEPAIRDVSLTIKRGQVVALVGENGSGKTTLAKLLTGLYLPTAGRVCWDGIDLRDVDELSIYDRIALVMQDPARWPMTAGDNIRIGRIDRPDPAGRALATAARRSGADAVIDQLPNGVDTVLSRQFAGGRDLSGGQWQRIGVARGIYRDAPILVADEPTASMDARAEDAVFRSLRRLGHDRTTVLITHRLANVQHADVIVVLDRGRIVELGTHSELVAAGRGYAQMFGLQAAAYRDQLLRAE